MIERRSKKWSDGPSQSTSRFSSTPLQGAEADRQTLDSSSSFAYPTKPTATFTSTDDLSNPNIMYTINDSSKIKKKIYIPKVSGVNFVGLLIGPKGTYQKRLEQQSGCKILIRGK